MPKRPAVLELSQIEKRNEQTLTAACRQSREQNGAQILCILQSPRGEGTLRVYIRSKNPRSLEAWPA